MTTTTDSPRSGHGVLSPVVPTVRLAVLGSALLASAALGGDPSCVDYETFLHEVAIGGVPAPPRHLVVSGDVGLVSFDGGPVYTFPWPPRAGSSRPPGSDPPPSPRWPDAPTVRPPG